MRRFYSLFSFISLLVLSLGTGFKVQAQPIGTRASSAKIKVAKPSASGDRNLNFSLEHYVTGAGRTVLIDVPANAAISISNGAVARVEDLGTKIQITGIKSGITTISLADRQFTIDVLSESKFNLFDKIRDVLREKRGLTVTADATSGGGKVIVEGRLLRFEDWLELATAARELNQDYELKAQIESEVDRVAKTYFKKLIRASGFPEINLELQPQAHVVLPATPEDLRARIGKILRPYGFTIETSSSSLALEPSIRVKIVVAELSKSFSRTMGVKWPAEAQLLPNTDLLSGTDGTGVSLEAIEEKGLGKILASPTLLCRSGKEADFLAGGEFPIRTATQFQASIAWKKYGVMMHITPRADFSGRMSIGVATEVSMIDFKSTVDGVPGLHTNRIETHFDLSRSRTIALSGLLKEEWDKSSAGLPFLADLPILGRLFSSRKFLDNKTELVIFVTPSVAQPDEEQL